MVILFFAPLKSLIFQGGKKRITIEDASFTATTMGVKITVVLGEIGDYNTTFTSEFNPADIKDIVDQELAEESPVGQLKINLDYKVGLKTWDHKKEGSSGVPGGSTIRRGNDRESMTHVRASQGNRSSVIPAC